MNRPEPTCGLRHVALNVRNLEACERFYVDLLGMNVEWRPDANNVYLCSGNDNLALHRTPNNQPLGGPQHLAHIGFIVKTPEQVDAWYAYLRSQGVTTKAAPKTHRDGARSFYCDDPDGNTVQLLYHPPITNS
ncbi:MAG: VOC family protein [Gammaproteobacteria bacterium]|nr:VOC family protein [Gammaproteobacteria bacterium]MCI0590676.1 VOC family protein [Gammaproteobacteria bacterium]